MRALYLEGACLKLCQRPIPIPKADEVLIRVALAGLCRTDLEVIAGRIPRRGTLIPGHEAAGLIMQCGADVLSSWKNTAVSLHPYIGCGRCQACFHQQPEHCPQSQMLGVDRDGVFAEYVCVPLRNCLPLPESLDWRYGAYIEPLAAALGVLKSGLQSGQSGLVLGNNRIAALTRRVLQAHQIQPLEPHLSNSPSQSPLPAQSLDFVIESGGAATEIVDALDLLKPGGLLILKSRHRQCLNLPWSEIVRREFRIQGLFYGSFERAIEMLARKEIEVEDLLGQRFALEHYREFLTPGNESRKRFLELQPCAASLAP